MSLTHIDYGALTLEIIIVLLVGFTAYFLTGTIQDKRMEAFVLRVYYIRTSRTVRNIILLSVAVIFVFIMTVCILILIATILRAN